MGNFHLLDLADLALDGLDVTSLRDSVAMPETAASTGNNGWTSNCGTNCGSCKKPN